MPKKKISTPKKIKQLSNQVTKLLDIAKVKRVTTMLGGGSRTGIGSWFYTTGAAS